MTTARKTLDQNRVITLTKIVKKLIDAISFARQQENKNDLIKFLAKQIHQTQENDVADAFCIAARTIAKKENTDYSFLIDVLTITQNSIELKDKDYNKLENLILYFQRKLKKTVSQSSESDLNSEEFKEKKPEQDFSFSLPENQEISQEEKFAHQVNLTEAEFNREGTASSAFSYAHALYDYEKCRGKGYKLLLDLFSSTLDFLDERSTPIQMAHLKILSLVLKAYCEEVWPDRIDENNDLIDNSQSNRLCTAMYTILKFSSAYHQRLTEEYKQWLQKTTLKFIKMNYQCNKPNNIDVARLAQEALVSSSLSFVDAEEKELKNLEKIEETTQHYSNQQTLFAKGLKRKGEVLSEEVHSKRSSPS